MIIPEFVLDIINRIEKSGFEAYAVGGCVRDFILGKTPSDWDIATSAKPDEIIKIFSDMVTIPTGIKHGTITVVAEKKPVEITTYRIDGEYTDNRRPESVVFSQSITDDLSRRDFTVNAMAFNPRVGLVDPFGGEADIRRKLLRCVGSPQKRFHEDALRIMRALRFGATLGFETEAATKAAVLECRQLLKNIAAERISAELAKLVMAESPGYVLDEFMPVFAEILGFDCEQSGAIWKRNAALIKRCPDNLPLRLTILFDGILGDSLAIAKLLKALKLDNRTVNTAKLLTTYLYTDLPCELISLKRLMSEVAPDRLKLVIQAQQARFPEKALQLYRVLQLVEKILSEKQCYSLKDLAINGNDLQDALNLQGKQLGSVLNKLLDAVIKEKCENNSEALILYAKSQKMWL